MTPQQHINDRIQNFIDKSNKIIDVILQIIYYNI